MTAEHIERVFGRGRLKMATGEHVEVFREAVAPGERRRYTKRFLATDEADFGLWTEREWRILARLIGHGIVCVPDVVQFDGGASGGMRRVQTYDAGVTVDQWATLLPVSRNRVARRSIFEDCAHWWGLAHHCLAALNEIHALQLVHLDIKGDNICIPYGPAHFDPNATGSILYPMFARLVLIDFAFSLVSGERLGTALPIGWQKDYDYQSPRLLSALEAGRRGDLRPTQQLDWRCDLYSLAAMLKRYLPDEEWAGAEGREAGWTATRYDDARSLIYHLRECHDRALPDVRPHQELMDITGALTRERNLADSLVTGWTLARDAAIVDASTPITPLTCVAPVLRATGATPLPLRFAPPTAPTAVIRRPRAPASPAALPTRIALQEAHRAPRWRASVLASGVVAVCALAAPSFVGDPMHPIGEHMREALSALLRQPASSNAERIARSETRDVSPQQANTTRRDAESSAGNASAAASSNLPAPASAPAAVSANDLASPSAAGAASTNDSVSANAPASASSNSPATLSDKPAAGSPAAAPDTQSGPPIAPEPATAATTLAESRPPRSSRPASAPLRGSRSHAIGASVAPKSALASSSVASRGSNRSTTPRAVTVSPATRSAAMIASNAATPRHAVNSGTQHARTASASVTVNESRIVPAAHEPAAALPGADQPSTVTSALSVPAPPATDAQSPGASAPQAVTSLGTEKWPSDGIGAQASSPSDGVRKRSGSKSSNGGWLGELWKQLTVLRQAPAPVEERSAGVLRSVAKAPHPTVQPAPAKPASSRPPSAEPPRSPPTDVAPSAFQLVTAPIASTTAPVGDVLAPQASVPSNAVPPAPRAETRAPDAAASPPNANQRAPRPPGVETPAAEATDDELAARGKRFAVEAVPYVAATAYTDAYRALSIAYMARDSSQDPAIVDAVLATWPSETVRVPAISVAPLRARRLHEEARKVIAYGGPVTRAMDIELKAFGANPRDPDIAQFLALLHLWMRPPQPETARQFALFAIALSGPKRTARVDYWNTFAVASALSRRENDATAAFLVEAALSTSPDQSCRAALHAYASYGERLRSPVQAMLYRVHSHPHVYAYPSCIWPQY